MTEPILYQYPPQAAFGRVLPKNLIYARSGARSSVKRLFVQQVEQIVWEYKLAPETINIPSTPAVAEIQIFSIQLKTGELDPRVLQSLDQAIPSPLFFELRFAEKIQPVAAYKRPNESDSSRWVVSDHFFGAWTRSEVERTPLPIVLNLEMLYAHLLSGLFPYPARPGETLQETAERMLQIRTVQREVAKCEKKLWGEKQFNRKVEINAELRSLKLEFERLTKPTDTSVMVTR